MKVLNFNKKLVAILISATSGLAANNQVLAATLEEIVVTAQKREQNLQDVSVAVTAFSGEAMGALNMTTSVDIAAQTPGLNIGTPVGEGNNPSITLRGVGLNDFNDNNEGPIAVYRDGVYQSAMPGLTFQLFDLERVEILRGPQGTLYGRNATGGLINFISVKPTDELEGFIDVTVADYGQLKTESAISGSLSDSVRGRISLATNDHDGYVENRIGPDANEANSIAYRGQLEVDLSDSLTALLNVHGGESDTNAPQYQHQATDDGTGAAGVADFYGYIDTDNDNFAGAYDREGILNIESSGASLTLVWTQDDLEFASITAIENVEKVHEEDTDMGPNPGILPRFASENDQFSQEFRLSGASDSSRWIVGAYYFENEVEGQLDLTVNYPGPLVDFITGEPDGTFGNDFVPFFNYDVDYVQETESMGIFGQFEYDLSEAFTLIAGLRYTQEERTMAYQNRTDTVPDAVLNSCLIPAGDVCGFGFGAGFPGTNTFIDFTNSNPDVGNLDEIDVDNVSGKIGLDFRPNEDMLIFANIARGFKSGGFNGGFLDFTDGVEVADIPFDEELLTSYELGFKSTLADGTVRFNATAFFYDYEDYQALTFAGLSQFINNSDAEVTGLDLEMIWSPDARWDINIGASLLDTEVDSVAVRGVGAVEGTEMVLAPEFTLNGLVRYQVTDELSVQVDFNHQDDHYFDITNSDLSLEDAYTVWNLQVGYEYSENFSFDVFAKNVTDEEYRVYTFDFSGAAGFNQQFYAPPRWVGVGFNYSF